MSMRIIAPHDARDLETLNSNLLRVVAQRDKVGGMRIVGSTDADRLALLAIGARRVCKREHGRTSEPKWRRCDATQPRLLCFTAHARTAQQDELRTRN